MEESSFFKLTTTLYCPYSAQKNKFLHIQLIAYKDREPSFKMEFLPSKKIPWAEGLSRLIPKIRGPLEETELLH